MGMVAIVALGVLGRRVDTQLHLVLISLGELLARLDEAHKIGNGEDPVSYNVSRLILQTTKTRQLIVCVTYQIAAPKPAQIDMTTPSVLASLSSLRLMQPSSSQSSFLQTAA